METGWLEDFVCLADVGSFSKAAALRFITQSAFSRRIQALESWVGSELIDRNGFPTRLTEAGMVFREEAKNILNRISQARALVRAGESLEVFSVRIAVPHTLSLTYFPQWISQMEEHLPRIHSELLAMNVGEAALRMREGDCDLLMCYHHPDKPVPLDEEEYEMLTLGYESLRPYSMTDEAGHARFSFPGASGQAIPYLGYAKSAYLGLMAGMALAGASQPIYLERIFETDMAEALKMRVLEGHGVAFLPESAVQRELREKRICLADAANEACSVTMEVRLYRERLGDHAHKPLVNALWDHCLTQMASANPLRLVA